MLPLKIKSKICMLANFDTLFLFLLKIFSNVGCFYVYGKQGT